MPLEFDSVTNEPFLRLVPNDSTNSPFKNIIITPLRQSDGPSMIEALNDPSVYKRLNGPAYPYTQKNWENWVSVSSAASKSALEEYFAVEEARKRGEEKWVGGGQPVSVLREFDDMGGDVFLGPIEIRRSNRSAVGDEVEKDRVKGVNDGLEAGDPRIHWEMGFYLHPAAQGRGIMTAALKTLISSWYIPYMNAHIIIGSFHETNVGSRRVFEKAGFKFEEITFDAEELNEVKFGVKGLRIGVGIARWTR